MVTAVVTLALAGPAVAAAATSQHQDADSTVVSTVYLGTSSVPGSCTMTLIAGHVSSFRCPGATRRADTATCTLTVATSVLWTYSCPGGKTGAGKGLIPKSCKMFDMSGYRWTFSCPRSAFGASTTTTAKTASVAQAPAVVGTLGPCTIPETDDYLSGLLCVR
jgi:hypothetical protein